MLTLSKFKTLYINTASSDASKNLSKNLLDYLPLGLPIVVLCVGTDRTTGDCLGPLIGHLLTNNSLPPNVFVYGTLKNPVHAKNLEDSIYAIYQSHTSPYVIAIDASLGYPNHIGYITLSNSPLSPGLGVKKSLPRVGDISITGIVNHNIGDGFNSLQSTRLSLVMDMATEISNGILETFHNTLDIL